MLLLFFLGRLLEPALGTPRFLVLYFASLLAGSFGALILDPNALTVGASGAVFGLAGATFVIARGRGMDAIAGEVGFLIVFNLVFSFAANGDQRRRPPRRPRRRRALRAGDRRRRARDARAASGCRSSSRRWSWSPRSRSSARSRSPELSARRRPGAARSQKPVCPAGRSGRGAAGGRAARRRRPGAGRARRRRRRRRPRRRAAAPSAAICSQCSIAWARASSSEPSGITMTTSAPRLSSSPQPTSGGFRPGSPATSSPPAIEIISGIQKPADPRRVEALERDHPRAGRCRRRPRAPSPAVPRAPRAARGRALPCPSPRPGERSLRASR